MKFHVGIGDLKHHKSNRKNIRIIFFFSKTNRSFQFLYAIFHFLFQVLIGLSNRDDISYLMNDRCTNHELIKNAEEVYSKFSKKKMLKEELKQIEMHCRLEQDYMNTKDN